MPPAPPWRLARLTLVALALATSAGAQAPSPGGEPAYQSRRAEGQQLATSYLGKNVFGPDGEHIGDINDIVVDPRPGASALVVIGVGGFLGLGEKDVAMPLSSLRLERIEGAPRLVIGATREDLRRAPAFDRGDPRL